MFRNLKNKQFYCKLIMNTIVIGSIAFSTSCSGVFKSKTEAQDSLKVYFHEDVKDAKSSMKLLEEGNLRFCNNKPLNDDFSPKRLQDMAINGQKPFAVIITCADSRVAPELIFDQGLGDVFTIRTAGNVIDSVVVGSIEYAVEHLKVPLVIVLGHDKCGAVTASLGNDEVEGCLRSITDRIKPSVAKAKAAGASETTLLSKSIKCNILDGISFLSKMGEMKEQIEHHNVLIVGAVYHIESGKVEFIK